VGLYTSNTIFHRVIAGFYDPGRRNPASPTARAGPGFSVTTTSSIRWPSSAGNGQVGGWANSGKDTEWLANFSSPSRRTVRVILVYTIFRPASCGGFNVLFQHQQHGCGTANSPAHWRNVIITTAPWCPDNFDTVLTLVGTNKSRSCRKRSKSSPTDGRGRADHEFIHRDHGPRDANVENAHSVSQHRHQPGRASEQTAGPILSSAITFRQSTKQTGTRQAADANLVLVRYQFVLQRGPPTKCSLVIRAEHELYRADKCQLPMLAASTNFYDLRSAGLHLCLRGHGSSAPSPPILSRPPLRTVFEPAYRHLYQRASRTVRPIISAPFINWGDNSTNSGVITTKLARPQRSARLAHLHELGGLPGLCHHPKRAWRKRGRSFPLQPSPPSLKPDAILEPTTVLAWPAWAFAYPIAVEYQTWQPRNWGDNNETSPRWVAYQNVVTNSTARQ